MFSTNAPPLLVIYSSLLLSSFLPSPSHSYSMIDVENIIVVYSKRTERHWSSKQAANRLKGWHRRGNQTSFFPSLFLFCCEVFLPLLSSFIFAVTNAGRVIFVSIQTASQPASYIIKYIIIFKQLMSMASNSEPPKLHTLMHFDGYLQNYKTEICRRYKEFCISLDLIESVSSYVFEISNFNWN